MGSGKGKSRRAQNTVASSVGNMATLEGVPVLLVLDDGTKEWRLPSGGLHNEHGPAVERLDGYKAWCVNDKFHRDGAPAKEYANGRKEWYQNGELHRVGGPAVEQEGHKSWYVNGQLHREDGPAVEEDGSKAWYQNNQLHRVGGPALDNESEKVWYVHGQCHRVDGPAVVGVLGSKEWWLNDKQTTEKEVDKARYLKRLSRAKLETPGKVTF
jgi:hypothetical protein